MCSYCEWDASGWFALRSSSSAETVWSKEMYVGHLRLGDGELLVCSDKRLALVGTSSDTPAFHVLWTLLLSDLDEVRLTDERLEICAGTTQLDILSAIDESAAFK